MSRKKKGTTISRKQKLHTQGKPCYREKMMLVRGNHHPSYREAPHIVRLVSFVLVRRLSLSRRHGSKLIGTTPLADKIRVHSRWFRCRRGLASTSERELEPPAAVAANVIGLDPMLGNGSWFKPTARRVVVVAVFRARDVLRGATHAHPMLRLLVLILHEWEREGVCCFGVGFPQPSYIRTPHKGWGNAGFALPEKKNLL